VTRPEHLKAIELIGIVERKELGVGSVMHITDDGQSTNDSQVNPVAGKPDCHWQVLCGWP
jgi:hypothetical protein